jgi:hypothetical protein
MNKVDIFYKKNKNDNVFNYLEQYGYKNTQNYIPIYEKFFQLNNTNWNSINLNNKNIITTICSRTNENIYKFYNQNKKLKSTFFKLSPLIDPVRFMVGKYKKYTLDDICQLPNFGNKTFEKKDCHNNNSYVDGFFYYLSSQLLNNYGFIHATDFYGSYLTIKENFLYNIFDDMEYLEQSSFFSKNYGDLFKVEKKYSNLFFDNDTRKNKPSLKINNSDELTNLNIDKIDELNNLDDVFTTDNTNNDVELNEVYSSNINYNYSSSSSNSYSSSSVQSSLSRNTSLPDLDDLNKELNSITNDLSNNDNNSICSNISSNSTSSSSTSHCSEFPEDEIINAIIKKFPVQIISIEHMENTLDYYISNYEIDDREFTAILLQIIMILITYQKVFDFTHNDLHTNNIMYNHTEQEFLYYQYKGKFYKVPTYGKIFKIIDFGRSIYKFNGKLMVSDSYDLHHGDASTQYNFGPYYNENKPIIKPNKAFDLCRLACSLYDHFIDQPEDLKNVKKDSLTELIIDWIKDRQGRNILYKSNGKERYEGFKLYKMIAKDVYKQTPCNELNKPIFKKFLTQRRHIKRGMFFMNIDNYEPLT